MVSRDRASSLKPTVLAKPAVSVTRPVEPADALGAVEEPPRRSQPEGGVVPGQGRQLAAVGGLVQRVDHDGQARLVPESVEQWLQRADVVDRSGGCRLPGRGRSAPRAQGCGRATPRCAAAATSPSSTLMDAISTSIWPRKSSAVARTRLRRRAPGRRGPRPRVRPRSAVADDGWPWSEAVAPAAMNSCAPEADAVEVPLPGRRVGVGEPAQRGHVRAGSRGRSGSTTSSGRKVGTTVPLQPERRSAACGSSGSRAPSVVARNSIPKRSNRARGRNSSLARRAHMSS